jgi:large subunit ribosomal protein L7/L12
MAEETKKEETKEESKQENKEEEKEQPKEVEKKEEPKPVAKEKKEKVKETSKKEEEPVEVPKKFEKLVVEIEKMSVIDLAELVKILEKKFGVSATAPIMAAPAVGAAPGAAPAAEEKSVFNIELKATGDKKIDVIKAVRDVTGKGLKDSKDLVDAVASGPQVIKENVKKKEAEEIKKKFEEAGATIELK